MKMGRRGEGAYVPGGGAVVGFSDVVIAFAVPAHWERLERSF